MALVAAYLIAVVATPAGISGAVLLLPFQVSVLGTPSPSVTPTNLLYNVVSTPGALYRYWRQGQTGGRLALLLIGGTLPGVIAGSVIRVKLLQAARQGRLVLGRAGEQVSAFGEDRWRAGHPEPPCLILRRHDLPHHLDIGPRREQRSQPAFQGFGARALRHVQDQEPHRFP